MTCCTLGNLEIRTLKPDRFKNQSSYIEFTWAKLESSIRVY